MQVDSFLAADSTWLQRLIATTGTAEGVVFHFISHVIASLNLNR